MTTDFLELRSLLSTDCDPDLIDLIREHGNGFGNRLLEHSLPNGVKPNYRSTEHEREQYIKRKYVNRDFLQQFDHGKLDECLYENVETSNSGKTLHLLMSGANPNFSQKMFTVFDHAKRHQQWKQMKLVATNGGKKYSEKLYFDILTTHFYLFTSSYCHRCFSSSFSRRLFLLIVVLVLLTETAITSRLNIDKENNELVSSFILIEREYHFRLIKRSDQS